MLRELRRQRVVRIGCWRQRERRELELESVVDIVEMELKAHGEGVQLQV
jgi:hypothetical protein